MFSSCYCHYFLFLNQHNKVFRDNFLKFCFSHRTNFIELVPRREYFHVRERVYGVGKTTYVGKLVESLTQQGIPCVGFVTEEVREKGRRIGFDVVTLDGERGILSRNNLADSSGNKNRVGEYVVDVNSFEKLVLPLISKDVPDTGVIVIDEIGKMEMFSEKFVRKISELICSDKNRMIVTIPVAKGRPIRLVEDIRSKGRFRVETITKSNRDDEKLFEELKNYIDK